MGEPVREGALASQMGLDTELLAAWLRAAEAHGLVERYHHPSDAYRSSRHTRWLLESPDRESLLSLLEQTVSTYAPIYDRLPELLQGEERPAFGAPDEARRAAEISCLIEARALDALGRVPGAADARHVLDIGCGYGTYLSGLLTRYRDAHGVGVELDVDLAEIARRHLLEAGVSRRSEIWVGDFMALDIAKGTFDLILLNNNLYYFPPEQHVTLFERALRYLANGGVLTIQVPVATAKTLPRLAGFTRNTTAFDLFLRAHANLYGLPDLEPLHATLREVGFSSVGEANIVPGGAARYVWARAAK